MKIRETLLILMVLTFSTQCEKEQFDPWGVWNEESNWEVWNTESNREGIRIRTFSTGKYYEAPYGLYMVKHCNEAMPPKENKFPAIAIPGDYTKIEKYEPIENGFMFYLVGRGYKHTDEGPKFQNDTRLQVKMHFIDKDECYFEYVSREDHNGFSLSYFPDENKKYKRYRVNGDIEVTSTVGKGKRNEDN